MALTLAFSIGAPCEGGNHVRVTVTPSAGAPVVLDVAKDDLKAAVSEEDKEAFARVLLRLMARQLTGSTAAQIKAAIEAKTVNLTVTG